MKSSEIIIHPTTKRQLESLQSNVPQSLLLSGETGSGVTTIAREYAGRLVSHSSQIYMLYPDEKDTITIDMVRELYVTTRSRHAKRSIVIIDTAETMSREAQNAFLKLLEEPNEMITFLLTSHSPGKLLPTIHSRLQQITIKPTTTEQSRKLLQEHGLTDQTLQAQILFIANGLPAELVRLADYEAYRQGKLAQAGMAKKLLIGSRYERIIAVGEIAKVPRKQAVAIIYIAIKIMRSQLQRRQDDQLLQTLNGLLVASEKIVQNGHIRLQLLRTIK